MSEMGLGAGQLPGQHNSLYGPRHHQVEDDLCHAKILPPVHKRRLAAACLIRRTRATGFGPDKMEDDMPNAEATARKIIGEATAISSNAKTAITQSEARLSINEFFPEFHDRVYASRTNMPRGTTVSQFCILGRQAIFDLEPLSPQQFITKHRVDIRTAIELVERHILIPNLYVRDTTSWQGFDHMYDLVAASIANGERVDNFMRLKSPSYDEDIDRHRDDLKRAFANLSTDKRQILANLGRTHPHEKLEQVCATRWAYLDAFRSQTSDVAQDYCDKGRLRELVTYIRMAKHNVASETTAAIGGRFVWGGEDVALLDELESAPEPGEALNVSEELEYLLSEIVGIRPFLPLHDVDSKRLLTFLDVNDNVEARNRVSDTIDDLVTLAQAGNLAEAKVEDYKRMVDDYRKRLAAYHLGAEFAVDGTTAAAGAAVGASVGVVFAGVWGAMFGSAVGAFIGKAAAPSSKPLGDLAFRLSETNRKADKVISTLGDLKKSAST